MVREGWFVSDLGPTVGREGSGGSFQSPFNVHPHFKILSSMTLCSISSVQVYFKFQGILLLSTSHYSSDRGGGVDRLWDLPEVPKWLIVIVFFVWFTTFCRGVTFYIRNIHLWKFFSTAGCCSIREKFRPFRTGSGIEHWCFRYGHYNTFFKGHKVCLTRIVICVSCDDNSIRWHFRLHILYVIVFHLFTISIVIEGTFTVHFLHQRVMCLTWIIVEKDRIFS